MPIPLFGKLISATGNPYADANQVEYSVEGGSNTNLQAEVEALISGASIQGSTLTLQRRDGQNPITLTLPSSGGGASIGVIYERTQGTLSEPSTDITYYSFDDAGATNHTYTLFNSTSSNVGKTVILSNNRGSSAGSVTIAVSASDTLVGVTGNTFTIPDQASVALVYLDENQIQVFAESRHNPFDAGAIARQIESLTGAARLDAETLKDRFKFRPTTTSAQLLIVTHDDTAALGAGAYIRYTGANTDECSLPFINSGDVGNYWILHNDTNHTYLMRGVIEGAHRVLIRNSTETGGREFTMQAGEKVLIVAETSSGGSGDDFYLVEPIGTVSGLQAGSNITITGNSRNPTISATASGGAQINVTDINQLTATLEEPATDINFYSVEATASGSATVTLFDASATNVGKLVTISNNRPTDAGVVTVNLAANNTIPNSVSNSLDLATGQSATFLYEADNTIRVVFQGSAPLIPNFPANPNNDTNTFRFSVNGDTSSTWNRDRNTFINLLTTAQQASYELAGPNTSGITVNNRDGYLFRNVGSSNWNISVFNPSQNPFFIGSTQYTNTNPYSLTSGNTLLVLYSTATSRWEGTVFSGLIGGSSGAGGAIGAGGDPVDNTGMNLDVHGENFEILVANKSGATLEASAPVHVRSDAGDVAAFNASNADPLTGWNIGESLDDTSATVRFIGKVPNLTIYGANNSNSTAHYDNLTLGQDVFYDTTNHRVTTKNIEGNITYGQLGTVLTNHFTLDTEIGHTIGQDDADLYMGSSGSVAKYMNKRVDFTPQGSVTVRLPSTTFTPIGSRIILELSPSEGSNITVSVNPHDGVFLRDRANNNYTVASPLVLNSDNGKQIRLFTLVAAPEGESTPRWIAEDNGVDIITHTIEMNMIDYNRRLSEIAYNNINPTVSGNRNDIITLKNPLIVPIVVNYSASNMENTILQVQGHTDNNRTITLTAASTWSGLTTQRSSRFYVHNTSDTYWCSVINADGNYTGMGSDTVWIAPSEFREFVRTYDGTTYHTYPIGPVVYHAEVYTSLISHLGGAAWTFQNGTLPTNLLQIGSSPNNDRVIAKVPCRMDIRCETTLNYYGTTDAVTVVVQGGQNQSIPTGVDDDVSMIINKNGTLTVVGASQSLPRINGNNQQYAQELPPVDMVADDYITTTFSNMQANAGRAIDTRLFIDLVAKEY